MKFMIMNYKPYEYELLQTKLNKLGQQGYITQELSFVTIFNKVDYPVYYPSPAHGDMGARKEILTGLHGRDTINKRCYT